MVLVALLAIGAGLAAWLGQARAGDGGAKAVVAAGHSTVRAVVAPPQPTTMTADANWWVGVPFTVTAVYADQTSYQQAVSVLSGAIANYSQGTRPTVSTSSGTPMYFTAWPLQSCWAVPSTNGGTVYLKFMPNYPSNFPTPDTTGRIIVIAMNIDGSLYTMGGPLSSLGQASATGSQPCPSPPSKTLPQQVPPAKNG